MLGPFAENARVERVEAVDDTGRDAAQVTMLKRFLFWREREREEGEKMLFET